MLNTLVPNSTYIALLHGFFFPASECDPGSDLSGQWYCSVCTLLISMRFFMLPSFPPTSFHVLSAPSSNQHSESLWGRFAGLPNLGFAHNYIVFLKPLGLSPVSPHFSLACGCCHCNCIYEGTPLSSSLGKMGPKLNHYFITETLLPNVRTISSFHLSVPAGYSSYLFSALQFSRIAPEAGELF